MHAMYGASYFVNAVSNMCKMFMKLTTGVNDIKPFFFVNDVPAAWKARVFLPIFSDWAIYKKRVLGQNKSNLLLKIILYNTRTLQLIYN
jgi:hypothetical protein